MDLNGSPDDTTPPANGGIKLLLARRDELSPRGHMWGLSYGSEADLEEVAQYTETVDAGENTEEI